MQKALTERLFNFFARRKEAKVDKCSDSDPWNCVPGKLWDELKRQKEKV
jgi:hypothetical protein